MDAKHFFLPQRGANIIRPDGMRRGRHGALTAAIRDLRFMNARGGEIRTLMITRPGRIFMAGGMTSNNLHCSPLFKRDTTNSRAIRIRQVLGNSDFRHGRHTRFRFSPANSDGTAMGLHPACPELASLVSRWAKLAVSVTPARWFFRCARQYQAGILTQARELFSMRNRSRNGKSQCRPAAVDGLGGRCADLLASVQPGASISLS